jgi:hypothetical protein
MTQQDSNNEQLLRDIHSELKTLTQKVESAFIKDETGEPDYFGHRLYHKRKQDSEAHTAESNIKVRSNIITWIAIGLATILGNAVVQYIIAQLPK